MSKSIQEWSEELALFTDGTERLMYLVELAKKSTTLPRELRTDDRLIGGCLSKIWVEVGVVEDKVKVYYDSDALITKGITSIVCECFSDKSVKEAQAIKIEDFQSLGIQQLLTPQRRNGLGSLIETIKNKVARLQ
jgi:cysteine desulfuration protein SufE|tara:strand:+ start:168 stop:572 length:405 start_codon:yes stop_codon:yes gene_type:complete